MFEGLRFSGQWRAYQQRVIDEFANHGTDRRIHVVAAPGSGKTVLGLELIRRLARPAIVLSPSLTVRDQWHARLSPLFCMSPEDYPTLSIALETPAALTSATYQSLHAAWADPDPARFAALLAWAHAHAPLTLVLDEAHHLRREWWRALNALIAGLDRPHIVALTATPPYDAPFAEWARYENACGPIDVEIGIPELVRNGDLCPHQDHVVISRPSEETLALLEARRAAVAETIAELRSDTALADAVAAHAWLVDPGAHVEAVLERPEILSALLVHLAAVGRSLPKPALRLLGVSAADVPPPNAAWTEVFLNALLFDLKNPAILAAEDRKTWHDRLHRLGLIEGKRVRLGETREILRRIAGDRGKLSSIAAIAEAETATLGKDLRLVILADHIRASDFPTQPGEPWRPARLGVAPIFEQLRRLELPGQALGLLSGTLVALPESVVGSLHGLATRRGLDPAEIGVAPLRHAPGHVTVSARGRASGQLVGLVTELFQEGALTILVGTQALLGEGWDAPAINSLVLASNSASYMLSNQMRGRAIRRDPQRPDKVSSIWHLATLEAPPASGSLAFARDNFDWGHVATGQDATPDTALLTRRFAGFAGIADTGERTIANGLGRLGLDRHATIEAANAAGFARAADRGAIARDWQLSLGEAPPQARVRETATPFYAPRRLSWHATLDGLAVSAGGAGLSAGGWQLAAMTGAGWAVAAAAVSSAATLASLPGLFKAARLALRNGSLEGSLVQVCDTILAMLVPAGVVDEATMGGVWADVAIHLDGSREITFHGLSRMAERTALQAVSEVLGPVGNPRYLLARKSWIFGRGRTDYHAVPTIFGKTKALAEAFATDWTARVGSSRLVFTRDRAGRLMLLRARASSFAAGFQRRVDRRSTWR